MFALLASPLLTMGCLPDQPGSGTVVRQPTDWSKLPATVATPDPELAPLGIREGDLSTDLRAWARRQFRQGAV